MDVDERADEAFERARMSAFDRLLVLPRRIVPPSPSTETAPGPGALLMARIQAVLSPDLAARFLLVAVAELPAAVQKERGGAEAWCVADLAPLRYRLYLTHHPVLGWWLIVWSWQIERDLIHLVDAELEERILRMIGFLRA